MTRNAGCQGNVKDVGISVDSELLTGIDNMWQVSTRFPWNRIKGAIQVIFQSCRTMINVSIVYQSDLRSLKLALSAIFLRPNAPGKQKIVLWCTVFGNFKSRCLVVKFDANFKLRIRFLESFNGYMYRKITII